MILARPSEDPKDKTTLVVAPVALLRQWAREIELMTSPCPKIYIHHGASKLSKSKDILKFDVVLTSFSTIGHEEAARTRYLDRMIARAAGNGGEAHLEVKDDDDDGDADAASEISEEAEVVEKAPCCPMLDTNWYRIILDEAHYIKNRNTHGALGCSDMTATYRWALTGTPMQNSVRELYSLINFLQIKPYNDYERFNKEIGEPLDKRMGEYTQTAIRKVQALLSAIMLRRDKRSTIDGRALLTLPEKHCLVDEVVMDESERKRYVEVETNARSTLKRVMDKDKGATGSNILVQLLRLRLTCDHYLLTDKQDNETTTLSRAQGIKVAKTLDLKVVDRLKQAFSEGTECALCYDTISTSTTILVPCGHFYCGECLIQAIETRSGNEDEENSPKCPGCRAQFDPAKCINLNHFRAAHCPEELNDIPTTESESEDEDDADVEPQDSSNALVQRKAKKKGKSARRTAQADELATRFRKAYKLEVSSFAPTIKIETILKLLLETKTNRPGEKTILFSQFTSFLDLVQIAVKDKGLSFLRYDGSLNAKQRNEAVMTFESSVDHNIILVSLKAGNVGLNLTCANHVILCEPFWNPYVEDQAIDRAHRIGQQKEVFVHRLITKDSIEARIMEIQDKKRTLIEGAMDPSQTAMITKLGQREILYLFGL